MLKWAFLIFLQHLPWNFVLLCILLYFQKLLSRDTFSAHPPPFKSKLLVPLFLIHLHYDQALLLNLNKASTQVLFIKLVNLVCRLMGKTHRFLNQFFSPTTTFLVSSRALTKHWWTETLKTLHQIAQDFTDSFNITLL